jgi:hypothetical protein
MGEEQTAIANELDIPAIEPQTPEVKDDGFFSPDNLEPDDNGGEGGEDAGADLAELFDIEIDGETLKVPGKFKDAFLKSADYTQKTQAAAEERRQIAEAQKQLEIRSNATEEELQARGVLVQINGQLQQLQNLDWQRFHREDPIEAQAQFMRLQQLEKAQQAISGKLDEAQQGRLKEASADFDRRVNETRKFAQEKIKGWTQQLDVEIQTFATGDLGLSIEEVKSSLSPRFYKALYLAYVGNKALQRQGTSKPAISTVQPLTTVSAKSGASASKSLGEMSMDEYAAHRNRQEAAQRARAKR